MKCAFVLLLLLALLCGGSFGEEMPEWDYPLTPEILHDVEDYIVLTNRKALLDSQYEPHDLVKVTANRVDAFELRQAANDALNAMFDAAQKDGYTLYDKSAYRSYQTQRTMYFNRLENNHGKDDGMVAYPGSSDHHTGLGVDILNYAWTKKSGMNKDFALTEEAQWLEAHCQEFGYVLRYMEDKEEETGIKFEPWHFRYVGVTAARYIMERHLSLEEFTEEWHAYIAAYEARGGDFDQLIRWRNSIPDAQVVGYASDGEEELSIYNR